MRAHAANRARAGGARRPKSRMKLQGCLRDNARMTVVAAEGSCLLCDIVAGREESSRVYDDEQVTAFMDIQPVTQGHLLVVPRARFHPGLRGFALYHYSPSRHYLVLPEGAHRQQRDGLYL